MASNEERAVSDEIAFKELWRSIQAGDAAAQNVAIKCIMPQMLACVQQRFASCTTVDPDDAVASAVRTIQRRQWKLTKRHGESTEAIEPRDWGDLVGLLVVFAINKARTHRKKRVMRQFPVEHEQDGMARNWQPVDDKDHAVEIVMGEELRQGLHEAVSQLSGSMNEMNRMILQGKLDGLTSSDICDNLREVGIHRVEASIRTAWRTKILPDLRQLLSSYAD